MVCSHGNLMKLVCALFLIASFLDHLLTVFPLADDCQCIVPKHRGVSALVACISSNRVHTIIIMVHVHVCVLYSNRI